MSPSDRPSRIRGLAGGTHRWARRFATLVVVLLVAGLAAGTVLWIFRGDLVAEHASRLLNRGVFAADTHLGVETVGGLPFHRVFLEGVHLDRDRVGEWYPFLEADRVRVDYDLWGLLHGRYAVSRLEATGLRVELRRSEDGALLLPRTRGGGAGVAPTVLPEFHVRRLLLHDASLRLELPFRVLEVDSIDVVGSLVSRSGRVRIQVERLEGTGADTLGALLASGTVVIGDGVELEDVSGSWGGSPFSVDGTVSGSPLDLDLAVTEFPSGRFGRFLAMDDLDPGFAERLEGRLWKEEEHLSFTWDGTVSWEEWSADRIAGRGRVGAESVELTGIEARMGEATLSEVEVSVPLHDPRLTAHGRFERAHTSQLHLDPVSQYPGRASGRAWLDFADRTNLLARLRVRLALEEGHLLEIPFRSAGVILEEENDVWSLDSVRVELSQAVARGAGRIAPDSLDLAFRYEGDLRPWQQFLHQENLEGTGDLSVLLWGPRERPHVELHGGLARLQVAIVKAPRVELRRARGILAGGRDIELDFLAPDGVRVAGIPFSRAEGDLKVTEDRVITQALTLVRGDTLLTVKGDVRWQPQLEFGIERAEAELGGRRFRVEEPSTIAFVDSVLSTPGLRVGTPRGRFEVAGSWNVVTHDVDVRSRMDNLDYAVFFPPDDPPPVLLGSTTGRLDLIGRAPLLDVDADLTVRGVQWERGELDSVSSAFHIHDRTVSVDRLRASLDRGKLEVEGNLILPRPLYYTLEAMAVGPSLDPGDTGWDLHARARDMNLKRWFTFIPPAERPGGVLDASLDIGGTSARPLLEIQGGVERLVWRGFDADSVSAEGGYGAGAVRGDRVSIWQGKTRVDASGSFPLDLTLTPLAWEVPERAMDVRFTTSLGSLKNVQLTPWVDEADGVATAQVRIYGTPRAPLMDGYADVRDGWARPHDRDEVVTDITATIRFNRDLVTVERADGTMETGKVTARGTYRLGATEEETYELVVQADKAVVRQEGEYAAQVSGTLTLTPFRAKDGRIYPRATGSLFAHRVEYAGSLEPRDIGQFEPPSILYEVGIDAPNKIIVRTESVEAELGGEIIARQDVDGRTILGELEILRGSYQFFLKEFRVRDGTLNWNRPDTMLPEMDIVAETTSAGYLIVAEMTGRPGEAVITFTAYRDGLDANLSQSVIVSLLAAGALSLPAGSLGIEGTSPSTTGGAAPERILVGAGQLMSDPLNKELARLGFTGELEVSADEEGAYRPQVGLRTYLTPDLTVQLEQGLSNLFEQGWALEYRLRRSVFLRGAINLNRLQGKTVTEEYNLDLRYRHEY